MSPVRLCLLSLTTLASHQASDVDRALLPILDLLVDGMDIVYVLEVSDGLTSATSIRIFCRVASLSWTNCPGLAGRLLSAHGPESRRNVVALHLLIHQVWWVSI